MKKRILLQNLKYTWFSLFIILAFTVSPLAYSVVLSLQGGRGNNLVFVGLDNYMQMLADSTIRKAFINTVVFSLILVPIVLVFSALLANSINKIESARLKGLCSSILFFPSITSPVAYSFFFKKAFAMDGFINSFLLQYDIISEPINYLLTPTGARIAICLVCIWAWTGYYALLFLSAMQNIDPVIYKVAKMDGATDTLIFWKVTLPSIKPIVLFSSILVSGSVFQLFAEVLIISKGGPESATITLAYYIYRLCFEYVPQFGYAACVGLIIFTISSLVCYAQAKIGERENG